MFSKIKLHLLYVVDNFLLIKIPILYFITLLLYNYVYLLYACIYTQRYYVCTIVFTLLLAGLPNMYYITIATVDLSTLLYLFEAILTIIVHLLLILCVRF